MKTLDTPPLSLAGLAGTLLAIAVWSVLVLASLLTQREQLNRTAAELARIDAVANLKKDMAIRKWASSVKGVFIREEHIPPFNSLEEEERVTASNSGGDQYRLVSVTPIHLLLAIQGMTKKEFGIQERLTSKQLRNIENAPDEWENQALEALGKGAAMVTETRTKKGGHGLMRAMIPMRMETECLECHRDTLVPVGGLRGGATISIDLNTYRSAQEPTWQAIRYWHGGIWLLGLATILLLHYIARRRSADLMHQEEMLRENEAAFGAMAEGAVITDATGTIIWVNDAFCRISGFTREEAVGNNPRILKSGIHDGSFYTALWEQLTRQGYWRGEIWNRRKCGEIFPEEISMQALRGPNGQVRRYISIFSDITQRKKNENELAAYREQLEDLVRQRTEELTAALDLAEEANRSKSIFLANMNHELRTPLNAVIGFSQLMEKDSSLAPGLQHNLEIINHSGHHLLTLINDILELSKIESGKLKMTPEEIDLQQLLEQVIEMMHLRAEESGLELRLQTEALPPAVMLDPGMLRQVLLNLLSNAVKFTPQGRIVVHVSAETLAKDRSRLAFHVRDTGIGIAPANQKRIFSSFEQIGSAHHGGTGLGLTISQQYVQMMGGELAVDSEPGRGSDFHFSFEVATVESPQIVLARPEIRQLTATEQGKAILVVDDNAEARMLVRALLKPLGFEVVETANLADARSTITASLPDLILLEWYLPDGKGIDLIRELREKKGDAPRIVMLTANALSEAREESLTAGADAFLSKPFEDFDLYRLLEQQLDVRLTRPTLAAAETKTAACDYAAEKISDEVRNRLVQAAITLNPDEIAKALADLATESPALAEHLAMLCTHRHYEALWKLLGILEQEE